MSVFEILILEDKHGLFERSEDALIFISSQYFNLSESYETVDMALDYTCLYLNPYYRYEGYYFTFEEKINFLCKQTDEWSANFLNYLVDLFSDLQLIPLNLLNDLDEIELAKRAQDILGLTHYYSFDLESELKRLSDVAYQNIRLDTYQNSFGLDR